VGVGGLPEGGFLDGLLKSFGFSHTVPSYDILEKLHNYVSTGNNNNHATLQSGASYSADVPVAISANVNSISFNGTTGYVSMPAIPLLRAAGTISFWFKPNAFDGVILSNSNDPENYLRLVNSTTIRIQTITTGTFKDYTVPTINTDWHHMVVQRESDFTRIYLNGVQASPGGGQEQTDDIIFDQIGHYYDRSFGLAFDGKICDFRKWDRVLSLTDIEKLYNGETVYKIPPVHYKMNEGSGTQVTDYGQSSTNIPLEWDDLDQDLKDIMVSWWDLKEASGVRADSVT
jgi:hypothetical protein